MFNYYLHTAYLQNASLSQIYSSLCQLNEVVFGDSVEEYDHFFKEDDLRTSLYENGKAMIDVLFDDLKDEAFMRRVLPSLLKRLLYCNPVTENHQWLESHQNPPRKCAYWGASFLIKDYYHLCSNNDYVAYKEYVENNVGRMDVWMLRKFLFKKIVLCEQTDKQLKGIKDARVFMEVVKNLKGLDKYAQCWVSGGFDMSELNRYVKASYESEPTMNDKKCKNKRMIKINDVIGLQLCEAHVKIKDVRFHFYPHEASKTIYVAYIGKHLPTISFAH